MQQHPVVALDDLTDVYAFVHATLDAFERKAQLVLTFDEREELVGEGLVILYELHRSYEPQRPGYSQPGRFSGYAAYMLPKRLGDAWHSRHPEHKYVTDPVTGKRKWLYLKPAVSLQRISEEDDGTVDRRALPASHWVAVPAAA